MTNNNNNLNANNAQLAKTFRNMLQAEAELAVLTTSEIDVIFCCVPELHSAHDLFVSKLMPLVENWTDAAKVAEPVKVLVSFATANNSRMLTRSIPNYFIFCLNCSW